MINIDLTDIAQEFSLSQAESNAMAKFVLDGVTELVLRNWKAHARKNLKSSRSEYIRSFSGIEKGVVTNALVLMGTLPNMIENGASAFDMKIGLLSSSKAKTDKKGNRYIIVPFRFGSPSAIAESEAFSSVLPVSVYNVVKNKASSGGKTKGLRPIEIPQNFRNPQTRPKIITASKIYDPYKHKGSIYGGISKSTKKYANSSQSQYKSFRKISLKSDPNSWIHSGIKARNLANKAMTSTNMQTQIDNNIDNFLSKL